ncbi:MAG: polyribonucleotide nucleotidyltransferase [Candidatus Nealsonbacteria bacterium CG_4_10_14_0_2_um_filter_38_17]|uniref:Polyribonucleotide nucleotidyltransferase n=1 Tax=Candidatus Nealsonbacteria bacterium CG_4_10_14_0_2_um_filter_38_17 TaxID=1974680 RepID=A0A2M7UY39_9BACT|nr:MAG: polyribonucleotide nucleotidyltransferase [Candidatus Nealsonbacteria bacterium CG_4_10_14_0_2_um_filter_38_17]
MDSKKYKIELCNKELNVEISDLAEQANGNVFVRYGDTVVLATCVMSKQERQGAGFFPLLVDYEERYYAAGKIRGPRYIKRESRPSDEAILNARLIDRAIRPLFPKELTREVQVILTILSWDGQNDPDVPGLLAASLVLAISDIPWQGPLGAIRIGLNEGNFIFNPTYEEREKSKIDFVLTGIEGKKELLINMMEGGFDEIDEKTASEATASCKKFLKDVLDFQKRIIKEVGKEKILIERTEKDLELEKEIKEFLGNRLEKAIFQPEKNERVDQMALLKEELADFTEAKHPGEGKTSYALNFFEEEINRLVHENAILHEKRPDGRKIDELRKISCQVGVLPRTHGSGLFCRGQTKALSILTLGAPGDQQILEGMEIVGKKRFMHHYNFPPYSTGEIKPMRGPARRDIGHGMLVEKALLPLIPASESFPYTIRIVTEILSSNGSTSMASVSGSSLALMDAGVPIKAPATGIALGLMSDKKGNYKILTDIQGPEDHHGDMDFKVAGTREGITAIQMDVKISGITQEILEEVLSRGKKARLQILETMDETLQKPRPELSPFAPRILTIQINPDKIREVVGPGGKVINEIIGECGVAIDIQPTGLIFVTSESEEAAKKAIDWIKNITREVKVGEVFQGKVTRIFNFGAMVEILPNQEGLIHISELAPFRVNRVEDIVKVGDIVPVKVVGIDEQGRVNLSLKAMQENSKRRH